MSELKTKDEVVSSLRELADRIEGFADAKGFLLTHRAMVEVTDHDDVYRRFDPTQDITFVVSIHGFKSYKNRDAA